ncbi:MAG: mechanosensitive ion channel family protein [Spirochaetota bacterium]
MDSFPDIASTFVERAQAWVETLITTLPNLIVATVVVMLFGALSSLARRLVTRLIARITHNDQIAGLLGVTSRLAVLAFGLFIALELLSLDKAVTSLLAGVGVIGLALGFAFQDIASNFVAGFVMALRRPFTAGDLVEVNGQRGRVQEVSLRSTELETLDGLSIIVPNRSVFQNTIVNYTRTDSRRLDIAVGTAYGDDMEGVRAVAREAVRTVPHREPGREAEVFFEEFGSSSINFVVRIWLSKADEGTYLTARSEAMIAIKKALDAAGYTIPFPIRTLDFGASAVGGVSFGQSDAT